MVFDMKKIRIGSRDSKLAIIQSELIMSAIRKYDPDIELELITMKTTGDKILDKTLDKIEGKGLFVKELDNALYNNEVDITVHSYKDMPLEENPELPVVALSKREDPRDAFILPQNGENGEPIGSSSLRRQLQLKELFPGCKTAPIRGNVQTRLKKLDSGEFSAIVLAAAGIKRLGLESRIGRYFSVDEILPAASQGIIAVQGRVGENFDFLKLFHSEESLCISLAERTFVREMNGGCSTPIAAYATIQGSEIILKGLYCNETTGELRKECVSGNRNNPVELGYELVKKMKSSKSI
nr:porphobilinogen deaminase [Ruminiclostridium josui]